MIKFIDWTNFQKLYKTISIRAGKVKEGKIPGILVLSNCLFQLFAGLNKLHTQKTTHSNRKST